MSCALFTALGRGCTNFLPPLFKDQFDLEQFFVDVSIQYLSLNKATKTVNFRFVLQIITAPG